MILRIASCLVVFLLLGCAHQAATSGSEVERIAAIQELLCKKYKADGKFPANYGAIREEAIHLPGRDAAKPDEWYSWEEDAKNTGWEGIYPHTLSVTMHLPSGEIRTWGFPFDPKDPEKY